MFYFLSSITTDLNISSALGWAIQDQWSSGFSLSPLSRCFCCIIKNIYPIHCFGHSSSQSVSQWNSFSPLKYIVYKCYSCFRPGMGPFFSSSHLSTLVALFLLYHQNIFKTIFIFHRHTCLHLSRFLFAVSSKIFIPYIVLVTVRLSLFRN